MNISESYKKRLQELAGVKTEPITAYHGTNKDFDKFDISFAGTTSDPGDYGEGIYFDTDKGWAASYSNKEVGFVITAKIHLQNPLIIDFVPYSEFNRNKSAGEIDRNAIAPEVQKYIDALNLGGANIDVQSLLDYTRGNLTFLSISRKLGSKNITKYLTAAGYDGVVVNYSKNSSEIVVFDTDKIEIVNKEKSKDFYSQQPVLEENTVNKNNILSNPPEEIIKYVGNDTSGFNSREDAIEELEYLLNTDFPNGLKNIPNEVILYRVVLIEDGEIINEEEVGEHFISSPEFIDIGFLEKIGVMDSWSEDSRLWLLKCTTNKENVDIERTIGNRLLYPRENEFTIFNNRKIKVIDKKEIKKSKLSLSENKLPDVHPMLKKYKLRYPKNNTLIVVNINKLLARHKHDDPDYAFDTRETSDYPGRVERAKEYWTNYAEDPRPISPKDGTRKNWGDMTFEAPYITIDDGRLGFSDGRHRTIAMKELGYDNIIIEVPKSQIKLFDELK